MADNSALLSEADAAYSASSWDAALEAYKKALETDPSSAVACRRMADVLAIRGRFADVLEAYFRLIDILEAQGDLDGALEVAHWVMNLKPDSDQARMKMIFAYHKKGDLKEVVRQSRELARLYIDLGQGDQSIQLLQQAQKADPENLDIGLELAEMYVSHGHIQDGANQYRKVANAFLEQRNLEKAAEAFRRMKVIVPDDPAVLLTLGNLYVDLKRYNEAEQEYRSILRHNLNHEEALLALGRVCQLKKQFRDAILAFNRILSINPDEVTAKEKLGELYQAQGLSSESIKNYLSAAQSYLEFEERDKAIRLFQIVLGLDPANPTACRELTNLGAPLVGIRNEELEPPPEPAPPEKVESDPDGSGRSGRGDSEGKVRSGLLRPNETGPSSKMGSKSGLLSSKPKLGEGKPSLGGPGGPRKGLLRPGLAGGGGDKPMLLRRQEVPEQESVEEVASVEAPSGSVALHSRPKMAPMPEAPQAYTAPSAEDPFPGALDPFADSARGFGDAADPFATSGSAAFATSSSADPFGASPAGFSSGDPFGAAADPFANADAQSFGTGSDPFATSPDPFSSGVTESPFAKAGSDPFGASRDPFSAAGTESAFAKTGSDPFANASDPFSSGVKESPFAKGTDPFASSPSSDPFAATEHPQPSRPDAFAADPFAAQPPASDPFGPSGDPFSTAPAQDPFAHTADPFAASVAADPFAAGTDPFSSAAPHPTGSDLFAMDAHSTEAFTSNDPFSGSSSATPGYSSGETTGADLFSTQPSHDPYGGSAAPDLYSQAGNDPFGPSVVSEPSHGYDPFAASGPQSSPFASSAADPFGGSSAAPHDPFSGAAPDPFAVHATPSEMHGHGQDPFGGAGQDPFASSGENQAPLAEAVSDPFAGAGDPYGAPAHEPFGAAPTHDPFGAAPAHDPFGAAPAHDPFGAAPAHDPFGAAPAHDPFGAAPAHDPFGAAPAHDPFGAAPAHDPFGAAPAHDPFGAAPAHDPFGAAPAHDPFGAATAHDPFAAAPAHDPFGAAPAHDPFAAAPAHDPFGAATAHDPFAAAPAHDPFGAAPAHDPFAAAPAHDPFGAAPAHDPFGAAPAHDPFSAAPAQDPFGAAPAHDPFSAAHDPFASSGGADPFVSPTLAQAPSPAGRDPYATPVPAHDPFAAPPAAPDPFSSGQGHDPFAVSPVALETHEPDVHSPAISTGDPFGAPPAQDPFATPAPAFDPFSGGTSVQDPFATAQDPFAGVAVHAGSAPASDLFSTSPTAHDPFAAAGAVEDPFAAPATALDRFAPPSRVQDPFVAGTPIHDPFAGAATPHDPFGIATPETHDPYASSTAADPFAGAATIVSDPFGAGAVAHDPFSVADAPTGEVFGSRFSSKSADGSETMPFGGPAKEDPYASFKVEPLPGLPAPAIEPEPALSADPFHGEVDSGFGGTFPSAGPVSAAALEPEATLTFDPFGTGSAVADVPSQPPSPPSPLSLSLQGGFGADEAARDVSREDVLSSRTHDSGERSGSGEGRAIPALRSGSGEGHPGAHSEMPAALDLHLPVGLSGEAVPVATQVLEPLALVEEVAEPQAEPAQESPPPAPAARARASLSLEDESSPSHVQQAQRLREAHKEADVATLIRAYRKSIEDSPENLLLRAELADLHLRYGLLEDAVVQYRQILKRNPQSLGLHHRLIQAHLWNDNYDDAASTLMELASLHVERGEQLDALEALQSVLSLDPHNFQARRAMVDRFQALQDAKLAAHHLRQLAESALTKGNVEEAIPAFKQLMEISDDPTFEERLAQVYETQGDSELALYHYARLAERYRATNSLKEAAAATERIVTLAPDDLSKRSELVDLYSQLGMSDKVLTQRFQLARFYHGKGQAAEAMSLLQQVLAESVDHQEARRFLVDAYLETGQIENALRETLPLTEHYMQAQDHANAISLYLKLIELESANPDLRLTLIKFFDMAEDRESAAEQWLFLAQLHSRESQWEQAIQAYQKLLELDESRVEIHYQLAMIYLDKMSNAAEALKQFHRVYELNPGHTEAMSKYIRMLLRLGKSDGAAKVLQKLEGANPDGAQVRKNVLADFRGRIESEPTDLKARFVYGELCYHLGELDLGIEQFQQTRRDGSFELRSYNMLGLCFAEKTGFNMLDLAIKQFRKGLETSGHSEQEYLELRYNLAMLQYRNNRLQEALQELKDCYAVDIAYRDVREWIRRIEAEIAGGPKVARLFPREK